MSRDRFHSGEGSRCNPAPMAWESVYTDSVPHGCFADETAIDFPSVDRLVRRVRDAFLGERSPADTLTTEVSLSRRDASSGLVVPLDVPLRGTCAGCGGRGEVWTEPCTLCLGTGDATVYHPIRLNVPPGVPDGARFCFRVRSPHAAPVRVEVRVAVRSTIR